MYKIREDESMAIRVADNAFIPNDPGNRDWEEFQAWLAKGNTPEPEFTASELKAQARADAETQARIAFEDGEKENRWLASDAKKALDAAQK